MTKLFKVGKHARDLAGHYAALVQNYYIEVLELFAGLREPADLASDRVFWMKFQSGDDRLPVIAATWAAGLKAMIAAQSGVTSLEDISATWNGDLEKINAVYPDYTSLIDSVAYRVIDMLNHLGFRPEDHI